MRHRRPARKTVALPTLSRSAAPQPKSPLSIASLFSRLRAAGPARRLLAEFFETPFELPVELGAFARIPVAAMARFTCFVEIFADVPQLVHVFSPGDVERFERHISE